MPRTLFTVGYEGFSIDDFIAHLKDYAVNCLLDVRDIPLSRKPGFSKTALSQRLLQDDILYVHFKELGSPKHVREKLKLDKDYTRFFATMQKHLTGKKDSIENAYRYVINKTCCLMCFEHPAEKCHRNIVAKKIKERDGNGLRIDNI